MKKPVRLTLEDATIYHLNTLAKMRGEKRTKVVTDLIEEAIYKECTKETNAAK